MVERLHLVPRALQHLNPHVQWACFASAAEQMRVQQRYGERHSV
jgi:hypothetical protein